MKASTITEGRVYAGRDGSQRRVLSISHAYSDGVIRVHWYRHPGENQAGFTTPLSMFAQWAVNEVASV